MTNSMSFHAPDGCAEPAGETLCNVPELSRAALFIDFDGTLVEIAERPDAIVVPAGVGDLLAALHARTGGAIAVVSGRRLSEVEDYLPEYQGIMVGSHGGEYRADATDPENARSDDQRSRSADPAFLGARDVLRNWVAHHDGVLLEEKPASVVLHYRLAPDLRSDCTEIITALAQSVKGYQMRPSKMAVELMPAHISKKSIVRTLLERWPGRTPIAIGDDRTDEGMFCVVRAMGGYGIKVGEGRTLATYRVRDVETLRTLLRFWLENPAGASCRVD